MIDIIRQKALEYFPEVQAIRHHIHSHPELSFEEYNTSAFVSQKLTEWDTSSIRCGGYRCGGFDRGEEPHEKMYSPACRYGCAADTGVERCAL